MNPDGKTIYIATDPGGLAEALGGGTTTVMQNPGAILSFTYVGEGAPSKEPATPISVVNAGGATKPVTLAGVPPQYTDGQAAAGKTAYNANCAVCHGNTMMNGTFGPPLAGQYFDNAWRGHSLRAFYDRAKAMPPSAPASLEAETYANIVAYILQVNGLKAGTKKLQSGGEELDPMTIR